MLIVHSLTLWLTWPSISSCCFYEVLACLFFVSKDLASTHPHFWTGSPRSTARRLCTLQIHLMKPFLVTSYALAHCPQTVWTAWGLWTLLPRPVRLQLHSLNFPNSTLDPAERWALLAHIEMTSWCRGMGLSGWAHCRLPLTMPLWDRVSRLPRSVRLQGQSAQLPSSTLDLMDR